MANSAIFSTLRLISFAIKPAVQSHVKPSHDNKVPHPAIAAFESSLVSQLHTLSSYTHNSDQSWLSFPWLENGMSVVLSIHNSAYELLQDCSINGDSSVMNNLTLQQSKWLEQILHDNGKLLDACVAIKEAIADIKAFHSHVRVAIHALTLTSNNYKQNGENDTHLGQAQLRRAHRALSKHIECLKKKRQACHGDHGASFHRRSSSSKLELCRSMLRRMGERLISMEEHNENYNHNHYCSLSGSQSDYFFMVTYAVQLITIFICGTLTTTLSLRPRALSTLSALSINGSSSSWANSLASLQQTLRSQIEEKRSLKSELGTPSDPFLLEELQSISNAVFSLHEKISSYLNEKKLSPKGDIIGEHLLMKSIHQGTKTIRSCFNSVDERLSTLEMKIDNVCKVLIRNRICLLGIHTSQG